MGFLGLTELLILFVVLPVVGLLIAAFCLALAAYRRVKRLERRMDESRAPQIRS
jgi:predicted PurR-regulated permease PerM